jgi:hypothetical protein
MGKHSSKVICYFSCINDILKPSIEKFPSGKISRAFVSKHKQFSGGISAIEKDSFGVVIVVGGLVSASVPYFTAVVP